MKISVEVDTKELNKKLNQYMKDTDVKFNDEIAATGLMIESNAKKRAPFDNGILRSSIQTDNSRKGVSIVETDVKYAPYQEFGTRFMPAHPFLRPAFDEEVKTLVNRLKQAYRK